MQNTREENPQSKLPKMKIFQTIHKNLSIIGIGPDSAQQLRQFNAKILINLSTLCVGFNGVLVYIIIEAKTFLEFTQSIYLCTTYAIVTFVFIVLIFKLNELFKAINDCECLANTSKWGEKKQISRVERFFSMFFLPTFQN